MISLRGDLIRYEWRGHAWELPIGSVRVIGEATTDQGPFVDDYWLYFVTSLQDWYMASFYAEGSNAFLNQLSDRLGVPLVWHLSNCAHFASHVLWPPDLAGSPMFVYKDKWPANRLARVAVKLLGGPFSKLQVYTEEVERFLRLAA